jgi:hypothetical protein
MYMSGTAGDITGTAPASPRAIGYANNANELFFCPTPYLNAAYSPLAGSSSLVTVGTLSAGNVVGAIADKSLSLAKLADGTDGQLITWDANGVIAAVAAGNASQILTSNGAGAAPTFQDAAAGTPEAGFVLTEEASIGLDPSGSADEKWTGITVTGTAGATLAVGDLCYLDVTATEWLLANADAAATSGGVVLGLCVLAGNDGEATKLLLYGTMRSAAFPASIALGAAVYVSTTAGDIQAAQPTGTDDVIRVVGHAVTAEPNTILFNPSPDWITHV